MLFFTVGCSAAEAFFKQAIEITENALGKDHPSLVKVRCGDRVHVIVRVASNL